MLFGYNIQIRNVWAKLGYIELWMEYVGVRITGYMCDINVDSDNNLLSFQLEGLEGGEIF